MTLVIDTNVAIAANGRDTQTVVLDKLGLMFEEYSRHLNYRGQPGVGDLFFKYLHDHKYAKGKIQLVTITHSSDETKGFDELPPNSLDKSDRKFLAAAQVSKADIVNALDSDWYEHRAFIATLGISVTQLCPEHGCKATVI